MPQPFLSVATDLHGTARARATRVWRVLALLAALLLVVAPLSALSALSAQSRGTPGARKASKGATATSAAAPSLVGSWSGTATIPLKDSSIVVPVLYTFTQAAASAPIVGTAMVPGQGSGPISHVVRDGAQVRFRVTAPEGRVLEHEGTLGPDGALDGTVSMDGQPLARIRVTPRKDGTTTR
jgi:hypothetical protein